MGLWDERERYLIKLAIISKNDIIEIANIHHLVQQQFGNPSYCDNICSKNQGDIGWSLPAGWFVSNIFRVKQGLLSENIQDTTFGNTTFDDFKGFPGKLQSFPLNPLQTRIGFHNFLSSQACARLGARTVGQQLLVFRYGVWDVVDWPRVDSRKHYPWSYPC